jgi:hypothetical protein
MLKIGVIITVLYLSGRAKYCRLPIRFDVTVDKPEQDPRYYGYFAKHGTPICLAPVSFPYFELRTALKYSLLKSILMEIRIGTNNAAQLPIQKIHRTTSYNL